MNGSFLESFLESDNPVSGIMCLFVMSPLPFCSSNLTSLVFCIILEVTAWNSFSSIHFTSFIGSCSSAHFGNLTRCLYHVCTDSSGLHWRYPVVSSKVVSPESLSGSFVLESVSLANIISISLQHGAISLFPGSCHLHMLMFARCTLLWMMMSLTLSCMVPGFASSMSPVFLLKSRNVSISTSFSSYASAMMSVFTSFRHSNLSENILIRWRSLPVTMRRKRLILFILKEI